MEDPTKILENAMWIKNEKAFFQAMDLQIFPVIGDYQAHCPGSQCDNGLAHAMWDVEWGVDR